MNSVNSTLRLQVSLLAIAVVLTSLGCSRPAAPSDKELAGRTSTQSDNRSLDEIPAVSPAQEDEELSEELRAALDAIRDGQSYQLQVMVPVPQGLWNQLTDLDGKLFDLLLDGGGCGDNEVAKLASLPSLTHLRIRESQLTDAGLQAIAQQHPDLQILNLPQSSFSAAGLQALHQLPNLRQLRIGGPTMDDAALEQLALLPKLQYLHLIGPRITGQGLAHLASSPKLASLYVDDCPLPDDAWLALFQAKPRLHVHIDQQHHDRDPKAHHEP